jgi:hypothetical protein
MPRNLLLSAQICWCNRYCFKFSEWVPTVWVVVVVLWSVSCGLCQSKYLLLLSFVPKGVFATFDLKSRLGKLQWNVVPTIGVAFVYWSIAAHQLPFVFIQTYLFNQLIETILNKYACQGSNSVEIEFALASQCPKKLPTKWIFHLFPWWQSFKLNLFFMSKLCTYLRPWAWRKFRT